MPNNNIIDSYQIDVASKINNLSLIINDKARITPLLTFADLKEKVFQALEKSQSEESRQQTITFYFRLIDSYQARIAASQNGVALFSGANDLRHIKRVSTLQIQQESQQLAEKLKKDTLSEIRLQNQYVQCRELCQFYKNHLITEMKNNGATDRIISSLAAANYQGTPLDNESELLLQRLLLTSSFDSLTKKFVALDKMQSHLRSGKTYSEMLSDFFGEFSVKASVLTPRRGGDSWYSNFLKSMKDIIATITGCFKTTGEEVVDQLRQHRPR